MTDKTVGRPFDGDAARAAQAKAVETRMKNKAEKEALDKNPNGPVLNEIKDNTAKMVSLLEQLVKSDSRRHPSITELL